MLLKGQKGQKGHIFKKGCCLLNELCNSPFQTSIHADGLFVLVRIIPLEPMDGVGGIVVFAEGFPFLVVNMAVQPQHVGGVVVMGTDAIPEVLAGCSPSCGHAWGKTTAFLGGCILTISVITVADHQLFAGTVFHFAETARCTCSASRRLVAPLGAVRVPVGDVVVHALAEIGGVGVGEFLRGAEVVQADGPFKLCTIARVQFDAAVHGGQDMEPAETCVDACAAAGLGLEERGDEMVVVVASVHDVAETDLLQVIGARDGMGLLLGLRQRGQQHGGENGDDGDDDQQLDQCKP